MPGKFVKSVELLAPPPSVVGALLAVVGVRFGCDDFEELCKFVQRSGDDRWTVIDYHVLNGFAARGATAFTVSASFEVGAARPRPGIVIDFHQWMNGSDAVSVKLDVHDSKLRLEFRADNPSVDRSKEYLDQILLFIGVKVESDKGDRQSSASWYGEVHVTLTD